MIWEEFLMFFLVIWVLQGDIANKNAVEAKDKKPKPDAEINL